jgi:WD40 repeat protein
VAVSNTQLALGKFGDSTVAPKIISAHQRTIHALAFSPDYTRFASCALDQTIKVWNWQSHTPERSFVPSGKDILSVAYSPDGNLIAFADDRWLRTWLWKNGTTRRLTLHRDKILHVCCSPTWIASASEGGEIRQTHRTTGAAKHLGQESGQITSMTYSPDYRFLVTSNTDGRLRLYDTEAFRLIHTWNAHLGKAIMVRFSNDGNTLYSAGEDSSIRVWSLPRQFSLSAQLPNILKP